MGSKGLGIFLVRLPNLEPYPPQRITTWFILLNFLMLRI